jgi:hypothetical protein
VEATKQMLKEFALHQLFLQSARLAFLFAPRIPASIFVFDVEEIGDIETQWDFADAFNLMLISCRIGKVGIMAALQDGGAQRDWGEGEAVDFIESVAMTANDEQWKDRGATVRDTKKKLDAGEKTTGLPKLAELLGEKVVNRMCEWLGIAACTSTAW